MSDLNSSFIYADTQNLSSSVVQMPSSFSQLSSSVLQMSSLSSSVIFNGSVADGETATTLTSQLKSPSANNTPQPNLVFPKKQRSSNSPAAGTSPRADSPPTVFTSSSSSSQNSTTTQQTRKPLPPVPKHSSNKQASPPEKSIGDSFIYVSPSQSGQAQSSSSFSLQSSCFSLQNNTQACPPGGGGGGGGGSQPPPLNIYGQEVQTILSKGVCPLDNCNMEQAPIPRPNDPRRSLTAGLLCKRCQARYYFDAGLGLFLPLE